MPELILPYVEELTIDRRAHFTVHAAMLDASTRVFDDASVQREWKITALPIGSAIMAGRPENRYKTSYSFMDMTVATEFAADDMSCELFFHGHPEQRTATATMDPSGNFNIHPDYAGNRQDSKPNLEADSWMPKIGMFKYLFGLLGHKTIPLEMYDQVSPPDFSSTAAIYSLLDGFFGNKNARSSTLTQKAEFLSMVDASPVQVEFISTTTHVPKQADKTTLQLNAATQMDLLDGVALEKRIKYGFEVGSRPDTESTTAQLSLHDVGKSKVVADENLEKLIAHTSEQTSEYFIRQVRGALGNLDEKIAETRLAD